MYKKSKSWNRIRHVKTLKRFNGGKYLGKLQGTEFVMHAAKIMLRKIMHLNYAFDTRHRASGCDQSGSILLDRQQERRGAKMHRQGQRNHFCSVHKMHH